MPSQSIWRRNELRTQSPSLAGPETRAEINKKKTSRPVGLGGGVRCQCLCLLVCFPKGGFGLMAYGSKSTMGECVYLVQQ